MVSRRARGGGRMRHLAGCAGRIALVCGLAIAIGACEGIKGQLGLKKQAPDEFSVVQKRPLIIPPDFSLRPPEPGAAGPREIATREQARQALVRAGQTSAAPDADRLARPGRSRGEVAFLRQAGADKANPDIRSVIRYETLALTEKDESFTRKLMFWRKDETEEAVVVDAAKEAERLKDAAAKGEAPGAGEAPVIERKNESILKKIF
jgi:hypothetical protein